MNTTNMTMAHINRSRQTAEFVRSSSSGCARCGGLMIGERCMDIGESLGGYWFWAMRCIQCGDIVDEVIMRNRCRPQEQVTAVVQAA
ncbi:MAG: hypothetical protein JNM35_00500 [Nitrospira sp.]|nr:hypothetical protein [Nitrospira sp.]MCS6263603.1 hypothetical protein [Nitrospira sp.]